MMIASELWNVLNQLGAKQAMLDKIAVFPPDTCATEVAATEIDWVIWIDSELGGDGMRLFGDIQSEAYQKRCEAIVTMRNVADFEAAEDAYQKAHDEGLCVLISSVIEVLEEIFPS